MAKGSAAAIGLSAAKSVAYVPKKAIDTSMGVAEHAAVKTIDLAVKQPQAAQMHKYGEAKSAESIAYRERLDNVSHTAATVDNVMNVATDPKKILGIIMLVGLVCFIIWLLKDQLKTVFSGVGEVVDSFFKKIKARKIAKEKGGNTDPGIRTLSNSEALALADSIYSAFSWIDDKEQVIYSSLRQIEGDINWELVQQQWGPTRQFKRFVTGNKSVNLPMALCLLDRDETEMCRSILRNNGVVNLGF